MPVSQLLSSFALQKSSFEHLTARELEILSLAAIGNLDKQVAASMSIRPGTLITYWARIRRKLSISSRSEIIAKYVTWRHNTVTFPAVRSQATEDAFNYAPHAIIHCDRQNRIRYTNGSFLQLVGLSQEEVVGADWGLLGFLEAAPAVLQDITEMVFENRETITANLHPSDARESLMIRLSCFPLTTEDNEVYAVSYVLTKAPRTEGGEKIAQELFQGIDESLDLFIMFSSFGKVLYVNKATTKVLSLPRIVEGEQTYFDSLFEAESQSLLNQEVLPAAIRNGIWTGQLALKTGSQPLRLTFTVFAARSYVGTVRFLVALGTVSSP